MYPLKCFFPRPYFRPRNNRLFANDLLQGDPATFKFLLRSPPMVSFFLHSLPKQELFSTPEPPFLVGVLFGLLRFLNPGLPPPAFLPE